MGARVGCGRVYPIGYGQGDETGPWVATSDGIVVKMPVTWNPLFVLDWLKLHFPEALVIRIVEDDGSEYLWRFRGVADKTMSDFQDRVCIVTYGRSRSKSVQQGICVDCGRDAGETFRMDSPAYKEYLISGLCGSCQTKVFGAQNAV